MTISGQYDYWDFIQYPKVILRKCKSENIFKVLVDCIPVKYTEIPTIEMFFLGESLAEVLRDRVKLACVWNTNEQEAFLEQVATNRAANFRMFHSIKIAELWLLHDKEEEPSNLFQNSIVGFKPSPYFPGLVEFSFPAWLWIHKWPPQ